MAQWTPQVNDRVKTRLGGGRTGIVIKLIEIDTVFTQRVIVEWDDGETSGEMPVYDLQRI